MSREVTLTQDSWVQTKHHQQVNNAGIGRKGESITLFSSNGFHTVVTPLRQHEDEQMPFRVDATYEEAKEASDRQSRAMTEGFETVYGTCYEGQEIFPG